MLGREDVSDRTYAIDRRDSVSERKCPIESLDGVSDLKCAVPGREGSGSISSLGPSMTKMVDAFAERGEGGRERASRSARAVGEGLYRDDNERMLGEESMVPRGRTLAAVMARFWVRTSKRVARTTAPLKTPRPPTSET